jgi:hypothetical protein
MTKQRISNFWIKISEITKNAFQDVLTEKVNERKRIQKAGIYIFKSYFLKSFEDEWTAFEKLVKSTFGKAIVIPREVYVAIARERRFISFENPLEGFYFDPFEIESKFVRTLDKTGATLLKSFKRKKRRNIFIFIPLVVLGFSFLIIDFERGKSFLEALGVIFLIGGLGGFITNLFSLIDELPSERKLLLKEFGGEEEFKKEIFNSLRRTHSAYRANHVWPTNKGKSSSYSKLNLKFPGMPPEAYLEMKKAASLKKLWSSFIFTRSSAIEFNLGEVTSTEMLIKQEAVPKEQLGFAVQNEKFVAILFAEGNPEWDEKKINFQIASSTKYLDSWEKKY